MHNASTSLVRIIATAVDTARAQGLDYVGATMRAIRSIQQVEPDLTDSAARRLVETLRR